LQPDKPVLSPGRQPTRVRRAAVIARFNPDDPRSQPVSHGQPVFGTSEALDFSWQSPGRAVRDWWLTSEPDGTPKGAPGTRAWAKIANRYARLQKDDLVFVQRSGGGAAVSHPALPGQSVANPTLVGLWTVASKRTWLQAGLDRTVDRVYCQPLV